MKQIEFMIDGERMSFTPLPLGTLDIIERMKEDLCLDKEMMRSFPIVGFLLAVKHHRETIAKIAALYTLEGEICPPSVRLRSDFLMAHCTDEDLVSLFVGGMAANEMWIHGVSTDLPKADFSKITSEDILNKSFCQLIKQTKEIKHHAKY